MDSAFRHTATSYIFSVARTITRLRDGRAQRLIKKREPFLSIFHTDGMFDIVHASVLLTKAKRC